jgi:hypothetical protein
MNTAMAAAIEKAGGPLPIEAEFDAQLSRMVERAISGGAKPEKLAACMERAATKLRDAGQGEFASDGHGQLAPSPQPQIASGGPTGVADKANVLVPPSRDPSPEITHSEAGRVLRTARPPGAGAMQPRAYETRIAVRGESWLVSYALPNGPRVLEMTWDDAEAMERRMVREGGERLVGGLVLAALRKEREGLGVVAGGMKIGKTLPPAAIAKVADEWSPERVAAKARAHMRQFQLTGETNAA